MASSQFEGDANADGAIVVNIEPTQPTIVKKLTPPTKSVLAHKRKIQKPRRTGTDYFYYNILL